MEEIEAEEEVFTEVVYSRTEQRSRHLSDCIDSVGETENFSMHRHSFSDFSGYKKSDISERSPPNTPDLGYHSPGPSSFSYKPLWFRFSSNNVENTDAGALMNVPTEYNKPPPPPPPSPVPSQQQVDNNKSELKNHRSDLIAEMPVEKDAEEYNTAHPNRGYAVILNNDNFLSKNLPFRDGSLQDVANLQNCFDQLGFRVIIHHNLPLQKINLVLDELVSMNHKDSDCFVMVVLTHGMVSNFLWSYDYPYEVDTLWTKFIPSNCKSLAGKPKLFFIQACRGERLDSGVRLMSTQTDSGSFGYKIPNHADFLIAFSTTAGMYSFRHPKNGTWFIQSLCQELRQYSDKEDLLKILTRVSRRVAIDFESYNIDVPIQHGQKQVPTIHSMLIRDMYFRPK